MPYFILTIPLCGVSQGLNFSPDRGFYTAPITVDLSTDLSNAVIKYTLDSSWPSDTHGSIYNGPININTSTIIKAVAYNSTDTTKLKTHSYIYQNDVVQQAAGLSIYPPDTEMDPDVVNDPQYATTIIDGLNHIMSISVTLPEEDFIDPNKGIYANPLERGRNWERFASMEILFPDGSHLQENMGIRIHGGASRGRDKKAFRVFFRDEYGPKKLEYPLFGETGDSSLDALVFRCRGGQSWVHSNSSHRDRAQLYRDQIARELQLEMGHISPRGVQSHLYINGYYWGEYNTIEYPNQSYMSSYLGGDDEEYEIWNHSGQEDGAVDTWTDLMTYIQGGINNSTRYNYVDSKVDLDNLADYFLLNFYGGNTDWDHNNWYASKRDHPEGKWRFFAWDNEQFFKELSWDVTNKNNANKPSRLFNELMAYSDFKQLFMDKVHCHFSSDGILAPAFVDSMLMAGFARLGNSIVAESARWGDNKRASSPYTLNQEYLAEQTRLTNDYFPNRTNLVYQQLISTGFYDDGIDPVNYSISGGTVALGQSVSLTNTSGLGTMYYTLDGSDPRAPGGSVSSTAITYTGPISITDIFMIRARVHRNGKWSPNCPQTYFPPQQYEKLVINEIHYNPNDSISNADTISGRNFEFIELKNVGTTSLNLTEVSFSKGLTFEFQYNTIIAPDSFIVLADDAFRFEEKYGFAPDGSYKGKLDNGGENLWLIDPNGGIVDSLRYNDKDPWPATADKGYYSLALLDANLDNADGTNWSIQSVLHTPRAENYFTDFGEHDFSGIVINEIHYNPFDSIDTATGDTIDGKNFEYVELVNVTNFPIDLKGAFFSRGIEYVFPDSAISVIQPAQYIVLAEDKSSFIDRYGFQPFDKFDGKLDNGGETLWLNGANEALLDAVIYDDVFPWDINADGGFNDNSLALIDPTVNNNTRLNWKIQCNELYTPGYSNDFSCFTNASYNGLTINEIHYAPNGDQSLEFIEIVNYSNNLINLTEVALTGNGALLYKFDDINIFPAAAYPQNYIVLANDSAAFHDNYGFAPFGEYSGLLSNIGEALILQDLFTNIIDDVHYHNNSPWTVEASLGTKSLALIDADDDNAIYSNWDIQDVDVSPGLRNTFDNSCPDDLHETNNPSITQNQHVANTILTNGKILTSNSVDYTAGQAIDLMHNFEVQMGAVFHAYIAPCL